jgi:hypothetical protein
MVNYKSLLSNFDHILLLRFCYLNHNTLKNHFCNVTFGICKITDEKMPNLFYF